MIALASGRADWALGFEDETWWSRLARPSVHTWSERGRPLRLVEQTLAKDDAEAKALACYGLLVSSPGDAAFGAERVWLRFVEDRPVSTVTIQFLAWCCERLQGAGKKALLLIWDNASWHVSVAVKTWIRDHNREVKRTGQGVRVVSFCLPIKSPWLNPIEARWMQAKRHIFEAKGVLTPQQLAGRVCEHFCCPYEAHLAIPEKVP